jgi:uncharacterized protein YacL
MSNHLESAGKSLKSSASNLTTIFIITLISIVLAIIVSIMTSIDLETKNFLLIGIGILVLIINLILHFSFIGDLRDTGNSLILLSESVELKSSEKSPQTPKQQKTKTLKGEITKIKDGSGNFFLVVEDRRYYYDSESSVDKSIEHYNETGDLLEDGLLNSR